MKNLITKGLIIFTLVAFAGLGNKTFAQSSVWNLTYNMGFTTGEFNQYISKTSFRGFGFEGRGFLNDNVSLGGSFSWAVFAEQTEALESTELFDASGLQNRYVNSFPIAFNAHYYLGEAYGTRLFFGAGIGAYRINQRTEFGLYAFENFNWHFGFYPEIGVIAPVGTGNTGIFASLRWQNALGNSNADYYSYLSLNIGFAFID